MMRTLLDTCIGVALAASFLLAAAPGLAVDEHGGHHEASETMRTRAASETLGGLWRAVKAQEEELDNLIKAKDLGKVHHVAFAIRDLVAAMPEKSGQLSAEQQAKLKSNVKYIATVAERLDAAGDASNQSAAETGFKQLQSLLGTIEGLYPPEALK